MSAFVAIESSERGCAGGGVYGLACPPRRSLTLMGRRELLRDTGATMSQANVSLVRLLLEAFNSEDIDRVLALAHQDVEIEISPDVSAEPDSYHGHDGMRRYFQSFRDAMVDIHFEAERIWEIGATVVVALLLTATGRQTAIVVEQRSAGVWTFSDGKLIGIDAYASPADALRAAGLVD
jgi:ketosteroid isomerase-like protein